MQCTPCTVYSALDNFHCTLCTIHRSMYTVHCIVLPYTEHVQCALHMVPCAWCSVSSIVCSVTVQCVQCSMYCNCSGWRVAGHWGIHRWRWSLCPRHPQWTPLDHQTHSCKIMKHFIARNSTKSNIRHKNYRPPRNPPPAVMLLVPPLDYETGVGLETSGQ